MTAYDRDLHGWALEQARALRARSANEVDWENVAEEIESLGKQQFGELTNRLVVLLSHLLKWAHQPERRGRSWSNTMREQRRQIQKHLLENPSLKPRTGEAMADAYETAVSEVSGLLDRDIESLPAQCPFTWEQVMEPGWLPDAAETEAPSSAGASAGVTPAGSPR